MFLGVGLPITRRGFLNPAGYEGPLDELSASPVGAWSMRRLTADYEGPLVRLRRGSDNAESDFSYVEETGLLDTTAIATWLGGATGYVRKWYGQLDLGRDLEQATAGSQPAYSANGLGSEGVPCFDCASGKTLAITNAAFDGLHNTGLSVHLGWAPLANSAVALYKGSPFTTGWSVDIQNSGATLSFFVRGTGAPNWARNVSVGGVGNSMTLTLVGGGVASDSAKRWLNGSSEVLTKGGGTTTPFASDAGTALTVPSTSNPNNGKYGEIVVFGAVLSDANALSLNQSGKTWINGA